MLNLERLMAEFHLGRPRILEALKGPKVHLRQEVEDFVVDEIPLFEPSGVGQHLFIHVKKINLSTAELCRSIKQAYNLVNYEIGYAGRKDKRAVSTQWISLPVHKITDNCQKIREIPNCELLEQCFHSKKLRLGLLTGNRFRICLRFEGDVPIELLRQRAQIIEKEGIPNVFGNQRFGFEGQTIAEAVRFLTKNKKARSKKEQFLISALQSLFFNKYLRDRIAHGNFNHCLDGDVLMRTERRATFASESVEIDEPRIQSGEVTATGPLWGKQMQPADRTAMTAESRSLLELGVKAEELCKHLAFSTGTRRGIRFMVHDLKLEVKGQKLLLDFRLNKGSYATVFIDELLGMDVTDHNYQATKY